ncbi:MAG: YlmC/YmxH family sporulation protein [bacterium]
MRLSSMSGKEIINLHDGARLGLMGDSELMIEPDSGKIHSIVVPNTVSLMNLFYKQKDFVIPWSSVRKIGNEVVIVELEEIVEQLKKASY